MHVFCDHVRAFVQIDTQNGAAQRLHGQPAALHVEVNVTAIAPAVDEHLRRPGHLATETADVLFGEHRLQCALARTPLLVGQDEQAVARHVLDFLMDDASLGEGVVASQHVADPVG